MKLKLKDETVEFLGRMLLHEEPVEQTEHPRAREFLQSRSSGFFDRAQYPELAPVEQGART